MNIFVYSDESGVFDAAHNDIFVFGGVLFLDKESKDINARKFIHAEKSLRVIGKHKYREELKACKISPKEKSKLFRSLNQVIKFGVVINQKNILQQIFSDKKSKQRYLDYAYKIALKKCFEKLINQRLINPSEVENIYIFVDEHTTATNGRYELREALEQEFKHGTFNFSYNIFFPPIFPRLNVLDVTFCNSVAKPLIRAADIVANRFYFDALNGRNTVYKKDNISLIKLP